MKKSDQDLDALNSSIDGIREIALSFAATLKMDIPVKTISGRGTKDKAATWKGRGGGGEGGASSANESGQ